MQWRVMVELSSADGSVQTHELHVGSCIPTACSVKMLGLTLAQAKLLLVALQRHLVQAQTEEYCCSRRRCPRCGAQRPRKTGVPGSRPCGLVPGWNARRTTPSRFAPAVAAESMTLSIDTGHVRAVPPCQVRTFEIIVAQVGNDNGRHMVFASVPDEAYHQAQQLRGVLHDLGATKETPYSSGSYRNIDVVIPPGTICSAAPPDGAIFLYWESSIRFCWPYIARWRRRLDRIR